MENINHSKISMDEYKKIEARIDSMGSEEELIETHQMLIGKSAKCDYWEIQDCGVEFIKKFLSRDWSRTIVYQYRQGARKFIQSKYLSDYFKTSIRSLLSDTELNKETLSALNSDKIINDMSEEEIASLYYAIKDFYAQSKSTEKVSVANHLMSLLYKLNGKGIIAFIKNNIDSRNLASQILLTSGLNDRASYYSGRGVNYSDLSEENLVEIFNKLLKLDVNYATNFVEMIRKMKTLGATEFINSFMNFAVNGFKSDNRNIENSNISLNGAYGKERDVIAFISIFSAMSIENDQDDQIWASEQMKDSFMSRIRPILETISSSYGESDVTYYQKRR